MIRTAVDATELREMLLFVSRAITNEESRLNALDAAIGDGDHGTTVRIGFQAVMKGLDNTPAEADVPRIMGVAGRSFMEAAGGAIGIILGRMLLSGQKALAGRKTLGLDELRLWMDAMVSTIQAVGKAKPGDKTILDSVNAGNVALSSLVSPTSDIREALLVVGQAAQRGASDTAQMLCKVGRASRLGDQVLGHPDPGAVTFSIIMSSLYEWLINHPARNAEALHPLR